MEHKPATQKQRWYLVELGFKGDTSSLTILEAMKTIDQLIKEKQLEEHRQYIDDEIPIRCGIGPT